MTNLQKNKTYFYQVGDQDGGWSDIISFSTSMEFPISVVTVGDIGSSDNSQMVLDAILREEQRRGKNFNFLMHAGDLSYANGVSSIWDKWGNMIQPIANHIPYMVSVGNHELFSLFLAYEERFQTPYKESGSPAGDLYYSFDYSLIHVIALSSEMLEYWHFLEQYQWLEEDLKKIDRQKTPWVVAMWHTPWYNSNRVHNGSGNAMEEEYEDLLNKYHVNLIINGHVHAYERTRPVYKRQISTWSGPEYRTVGNGGNSEGLYHSWWDPQPIWSAYRNGTFYGFGTLDVYNTTHSHWQMYRADTGEVADSSWVLNHRPSIFHH